MWHVSSRSGVATLRTAIQLLLTYLLDHSLVWFLKTGVTFENSIGSGHAIWLYSYVFWCSYAHVGKSHVPIRMWWLVMWFFLALFCCYRCKLSALMSTVDCFTEQIVWHTCWCSRRCDISQHSGLTIIIVQWIRADVIFKHCPVVCFMSLGCFCQCTVNCCVAC